MFKGSKWKKIS